MQILPQLGTQTQGIPFYWGWYSLIYFSHWLFADYFMNVFARRNPEYYGDEPLRTVSDGNLVHRTGVNAGSYDSRSASQPEASENAEAPHENQYTFPSSSSNYNFENGQQLHAAFPHSQTSSQMQNLAPFSSVIV